MAHRNTFQQISNRQEKEVREAMDQEDDAPAFRPFEPRDLSQGKVPFITGGPASSALRGEPFLVTRTDERGDDSLQERIVPQADERLDPTDPDNPRRGTGNPLGPGSGGQSVIAGREGETSLFVNNPFKPGQEPVDFDVGVGGQALVLLLGVLVVVVALGQLFTFNVGGDDA